MLLKTGYLLTNYLLYKNPGPGEASALSGEQPRGRQSPHGGSPGTLGDVKFLGNLVAKLHEP